MQTLDYPRVPVGTLFAGAARRFADRTALVQGVGPSEIRLSHTALHTRACRFAHALHAAGVRPGQTVAVHLPNRPEYPVAYQGTLLAGAVFSPTNPLLPLDDLTHQLADAGAVAVVTSQPDVVKAAGSGRLVITVGPDFEAFLDAGSDTPPDLDVDPDALAHIAYTGGTTGRSKGVELTHRNVVANVLQYACWTTGSRPTRDAAGDVTVEQIGSEQDWPVRLGTGATIAVAPWFHAMGAIGGLTAPLVTGTTLVVHDRFDPARYLADAERHRVTSLGGAPAMYAVLLAHPDWAVRDLSSVRTVGSGAAPLPRAHLDAIAARAPGAIVVEGYGLTEVTMGAVSGPSARSAVRKPGTVGVPVFDTEVRISPPDSDVALPVGERGEVCLHGPQVMRGYRGLPAETAAVLSDDGWLRTGDIGVLDDDGYLTIVDRRKDMLIYKGYNVYPREIEEVLVARPDVTAAAVVGRRDDAVGELPVAFVVPGAGFDAGRVLTEVNALLVPYKRLRELHEIDAIPLSGAGKPLKRALRDRLEATPADPG